MAANGVHCLPAQAAWRGACTRPGPDAAVVCYCCVYNFTLGARCHVHPLFILHAPASCGRGLEGDEQSVLQVMRRRR